MCVRFYDLRGVPCAVELDDVLIYSEGKQNSLRATHLAISILERAGFKINYSKSIISPSQVIDYLGYTLDARRQCFCVQKSKLVKCKLILKAFPLLSSVRRKLMEQVLGFFNFIFTIVPLARSFIRVWYDQLRSHISDSSRVFFDLSPLRDILFSETFVFPWLSGFPSILCLVLQMQLLCGLLAFQAKDAFLGPCLLLLRFLKLSYVLP